MTATMNRKPAEAGFNPNARVRETVLDKFKAVRKSLSAALIEREDEIDLCLTALVAGEHCLFVGPPGTAKSMLLDSLIRWTGGRGFTVLLNKFTTPEEVFGPISLKGLKEDRFVRVTAGKLPEADFAFCDEIFKSSSAILNTMLRILNERAYDRGDGTLAPCPLKLCVAASNEWPNPDNGGKELAALFDRFLFRKAVRPIRSHRGRERLLFGGDHTPAIPDTLANHELQAARTEAARLPWSDAAKEALVAILSELAREGIQVGDRRQYKAVAAARAAAWLAGSPEVLPEHLEVLQHILWDDPAEQPEKASQVVARIANPAGMQVAGLLVEAEQVIAATNVRDLASAAGGAAKLGEIEKKLAGLASPKAASAREYVRDEIKRIRKASLESI
jgi:MoxR-like ATPase